jgi:chaperonin GroES
MTRSGSLQEAPVPRIKVVPVGDRVLIGDVERQETSAGGVILPQVVRESWHDEGTILALGSVEGTTFCVGDRVVYEAARSTELKIDGQALRILPTKNILAILRDDCE